MTHSYSSTHSSTHSQTHPHSGHPELEEATIAAIASAAHRGWAPEDILHIVGNSCHPILYRAALRVPAQVSSPPLRRQWLSFAPPHSWSMSRTELTHAFEQIRQLPSMPDAEVLCGDRPASTAAATPGERSAEERIRHKIATLLRKAESTQFEDEASALIAKAQSLQHRYRIEELGNHGGAEPTRMVARRVHISAPYIKHQARLCGIIAYYNGCTSLLLHSKGIVAVFGSPSDTAHVLDLFESLNRQCHWYMHNSQHNEHPEVFGSVAAFRRSFILAYAARIGELLHEATQASAQEAAAGHDGSADSERAALALATRSLAALDERQEQATATRDRLFPHLGTMSLSANSWAGIDAGTEAAEKSHLSGDSAGLRGRAQLPR
ncbi:DUF2786 domain-containing protein [Corynebacterium sp.]|uniref:DUF2786 domain-containing protein n=1 Tax=Corynebacterium sp. TaxID=1720 RepID=UPI0026DC536C|nr:DUF2786 domain-containing protein [Corynebacterium sp.]MDO5031323.1 DUF2786 domain-containing protein [Corynebacterium sp.]